MCNKVRLRTEKIAYLPQQTLTEGTCRRIFKEKGKLSQRGKKAM
jgi:hypothetical protein